MPDWSRRHVVRDCKRYGLHRPAYGQRCIRVDNDYLLIGVATGVIAGPVAANGSNEINDLENVVRKDRLRRGHAANLREVRKVELFQGLIETFAVKHAESLQKSSANAGRHALFGQLALIVHPISFTRRCPLPCRTLLTPSRRGPAGSARCAVRPSESRAR
ncbi:RcnB family protein [Mesorhizobium sp. LHD-90]|uniref:RcnB family protein n=1 Tax=Mesorhizobium sp. LHD-90 TaxID=3071414 RepID=UPI0027E01B41|nr:RcnB family protein [Mesorhizobium sp. LHD-90]MDQ6436442.1 RcnB family protein [Mesorhizobium sp. LHD-90]